MNRIIGIGGVSRAGKSFLAAMLAERLMPQPVKVFCQDDFVHPVEKIPLIRDHIDWETPASIDFNRLRQAVLSASRQHAWVIVEGLLVFSDPLLFKLLTHTIFIEISHEVFLERKVTDLRWGAEPDWYIDYIWESYLRNGRFPSQVDPDLTLDGNQPFDAEMIEGLIVSKKI